MSARVLLNLLNESGNIFRNEFNKFNNTRAWMLDSIYHLTSRFLWNLISSIKTLWFCHFVRNVVMDAMTVPENL